MFLTLIAVVFFAAPAAADPIAATVTGATVTVTYGEPTDNAPNNQGQVTPLTDLAGTAIYYDKGAGQVEAIQVPASGPTGGATITSQITIPAVQGEEFDAIITATATDLSGNESAHSAPVTVRIDFLPPGPPQ